MTLSVPEQPVPAPARGPSAASKPKPIQPHGWSALAGVVPLIAVVAGMNVDPTQDPAGAQRLSLAVFALGNAMILGMAIGDLGRLVLAMLLGGAAAAVLAPFCANILILVVLPLLMGLVAVCFSWDGTHETLGRVFVGTIWLFMIGLAPAYALFFMEGFANLEHGLFSSRFTALAFGALAAIANAFCVWMLLRNASRAGRGA